MKLATLHDGSRDGQLIVVSRDLASAHLASHIAGTLQRVLDDWNFLSPQLEDLYTTLNAGKARHAFAFDPRACLAPLPRAFLWAPQAPGAADEAPAPARGDRFVRPAGPAPLAPAGEAWTLQVQPAVLTGDIPAGADADAALDGVRLWLLAATWHAGGGGASGVRASAFAPVAATPDELGPHWPSGRHGLPLQWRLRGSGAAAGETLAGPGHPLGARLAALARLQGLAAGSLVGGPATAAGPAGLPGQAVQLQLGGPDGASGLGMIDLQPADIPAETLAETPAAAGPAPQGEAGPDA